MAKFKFTATTIEGVKVNGFENALTVSMARRALAARRSLPD